MMLMKKLFVSIVAAAVLAPLAVRASDDSWGTVDEGYSDTYSEASDWSYDGGSDYDSSDYDDGDGHRGGRKREPGPYDRLIAGTVFGGAGLLFIFDGCKREQARRRAEEAARVARENKIEQLSSSVEVIDDPAAPRRDLLKPIFYSGGLIQGQAAPNDPAFRITAAEHLALFRKVEVYCWREDISHRRETRGKQSRTVTDYKYTSCWVDSPNFIPSAGFRDKKYDMNVAPSFNSECF